MRTLRLVAGFLIAPWVPVIGYYAFYTALWSSRGVDVPGASAFVAALTPVAYIVTIVAWMPLVLVLRRRGRDQLITLLAGGAALGVIVGVTGLGIGGQAVLAASSLPFLAVAAALGLLYGAAFWAIALAFSGRLPE